MQRRAATVLLAVFAALGAAAALHAAEPDRGLYEDPLGRYRFGFSGRWQLGPADEGAEGHDRFFLIIRETVAAELIVSSKPFPAASRFSDFVEGEVAALDAEPDILKVSLTTGLKISGQPGARLISRLVGTDERGVRRDTLAVQYWFAKAGRLWSLLVLTTAAQEQRSKVVFTIEDSVISSFEALEPDEVALAIAESKKVTRLGDGLAEITLPESWTLLATGDDRVAAEFDKGRLYLFVVTDHDYGNTLKEVAHRFVENHASLDSPEIGGEGDCDIHGEAGYYVVFDGTKDGVAFRAQLITLTRGRDAFFLYGLCEVDAWPQARPWITAVQYSIHFVEQAPASSSSGSDENAE
jgi:hypothetical protein